MKSLYLACAAAVALSASAAFASDDDDTRPAQDVLPTVGDAIEPFRNARGWTVYKNLSRQSCFITKSDEDEHSAIQMGLTLDQRYGYVGAFVKGIEPEEGNKHIAVIVNGNLYVGEGTVLEQELPSGLRGGYFLTDSKKFVKDLESSKELIAFPDSPFVVTMDLKGIKPAIYEARECMKELRGE